MNAKQQFSVLVKINEYIAQFSFHSMAELESFVKNTEKIHPHAQIVLSENAYNEQRQVS